MPRLGYTKSRNGCMRCRQRRVKCDEKRPCTACIRHDVPCSLLDAPVPAERWRPGLTNKERRPPGKTHVSTTSPRSSAASDPGPSVSDLSQSPTSPAATRTPINPTVAAAASAAAAGPPAARHGGTSTPFVTSTATTTDRFNYFDKFLLPLSSQTEAAWIQDLELMHHYTITTSLTLPRTKTVLHIWQKLVPQLAVHYPFLVHQVLAIAAFHKAYLQPERRSEYSLLASQHQNRSIEGMRSHLAKITEQNCHALFITSSLLLICAFAASASSTGYNTPSSTQVSAGSPPMLHGASPINSSTTTTTGTSHGPPTIEEMLDVFMLDRGVSIVLQTSEKTIQAGEFHAMFTCTPHPRINAFLQSAISELRAFEALLRHEHGQDQAHLDMGTAELITLEIARLIEAIDKAVLTTEESEMRVVSYWPITMADEYILLLRQRNEVALALLVYYCCIMCRAEATTWFLDGWAASVAADAERFISPKWRAAVHWPFEQMRQPYV